MEGCLKPLGGEFWFDNSILCNNRDNISEKNCVLLNGGQSAIEFILRDINLNQKEFILMPSYLCPTILYKFEQRNINVLFYEIEEDLSINIESITKLIEKFNVKALFFINYFGFYHNFETIAFLENLKKSGLILIEDAVQMFWFKRLKGFIGDYVFNSYRKFLPVDGSLVLCNNNLSFNETYDEYYNLITEARINKTNYILKGVGREKNFLDKFEEAEKCYYRRDTVNGMDIKSKNFLNCVNYSWIRKQRLNNYKYIYDNLRGFNKVKLLFDKSKIDDNVPLALPVSISNRDYVRKDLRKYNIYAPVHWNITEEDWAPNFPKSLKISKSILSIPIDWRYDEKDMDYFLEKFNSLLIE